MARHVSETIMGAAVLGVAAYFFATAYQHSGAGSASDGYDISAKFSDITGIGIGSDVRVGGVKIGSVQSLELDAKSYQAQLNMRVSSAVPLPADSSAAIVGESLLGGKFVALTPGAEEEMLGEGGVIEYTQSSVSLEQLLGKFIFSSGGVDDESSKGASADDEDIELSVP